MEETTVFDEFDELIRLICKNDLWPLGNELALQLKHQAIKTEVMLGVLKADLDNICMIADSLKNENESLKSQISVFHDNDSTETLTLDQQFAVIAHVNELDKPDIESHSKESIIKAYKELLELYKKSLQLSYGYKNMIRVQWGLFKPEEMTNA